MIYVLAGTDRSKQTISYKKIVSDREVVSLSPSALSKETLFEHAASVSLFGPVPVISIDGALKENKTLFSVDVLLELQKSPTVFILLEDKLLAADEKKYAKYATISKFETKSSSQATPKVNTFAIADAYGRRDKVAAWALYCQAIEKGIEPEALSGILFWKIKTLIQNGSRVFSGADLKRSSGQLVSLYHKAHKGECDFTVGLEQFILLTLSK